MFNEYSIFHFYSFFFFFTGLKIMSFLNVFSCGDDGEAVVQRPK